MNAALTTALVHLAIGTIHAPKAGSDDHLALVAVGFADASGKATKIGKRAARNVMARMTDWS